MARALKPKESDLARIRDWAAKKVPPELQQRVRLEVAVRGANVTLFELQPPWCPDGGPEWARRPAAQLRHTGGGFWLLLWPDHSDRWQRYPPAPSPTRDLDSLLTELDEDGICLFWLLRDRPQPEGA